MSAETRATILRVAVPSPLRRLFDYLPPHAAAVPAPGTRVRVPFGRAERVGVVVAHAGSSALPGARLRRVRAVLDLEPLLPADVLQLLGWAAEYFHHPPGEVFTAALPAPLRRGRAPREPAPSRWRATARGLAEGPAALARAPRQGALLERLRDTPEGLDTGSLAALGGRWREALRALAERGFAEPCADREPAARATEPGPSLGAAQRSAVEEICSDLSRFGAFLLDGVTGSGKTEVYLRAVERVVAEGRQALVLVPEIGLTPQLLARFRARVPQPVVEIHSALPEARRAAAWLRARAGQAAVVIGTRSAVFTPLARPGLFVVDEEHDASLKQQDGFRYSARDVLVMRASRAAVPVILGSATPSLESLANLAPGRYRELRLPRRIAAGTPSVEVVDLRARRAPDGISEPLASALESALGERAQALLFLNRRGYAPTLLCHHCGWVARCRRCDAHLVHHRGARRLICHHCAAEREMPDRCPECGLADLRSLGLGTQRVAEAIARRFPEARVGRVDRDSVRRRGALPSLLEAIHQHRIDVLVGTQMLAKGHHFPGVTLVGIVDADAGLFSADFRGPERMAQLLVQVAGRAGRGERPGRVLIQTHHPEHPLLACLARGGYREFARAALAERRAARLPPFTHLALLRIEAHRPEPAARFAASALEAAPEVPAVALSGPVPAPMERRAGRHRLHLLVESEERAPLHRFLDRWLVALEGLAGARRARWSLDVDPFDLR